MRRIVRIVAALAAGLTGVYLYWRKNRRTGARFMNDVVNPALLKTAVMGGGRAELGTIEHVGRVSGMRRLTPVRPVATEDGFRILVPLGLESRWAQNVLAAGHCRMQLGDTVYELDEPALLLPREMAELPEAGRWLSSLLGFLYLRLHTFASRPGTLDEADAPAQPVDAGAAAAHATRHHVTPEVGAPVPTGA